MGDPRYGPIPDTSIHNVRIPRKRGKGVSGYSKHAGRLPVVRPSMWGTFFGVPITSTKHLGVYIGFLPFLTTVPVLDIVLK